MLKTTPRLSVDTTVVGIHVRPSAAWLPVKIEVTEDSPTDALASLRTRMAAVVEAAGGGVSLDLRDYKAWTEKLVGKGFFGQGIRHHARGTGVLRMPFAADADYLDRVTSLEALRERLAPLEDTHVVIGGAQYVVEEPEAHRAELLQALRAKIETVCTTFDVVLGGFDLPVDLDVTVQGPARARVNLAARVQLVDPRVSSGVASSRGFA